MIEPMTEAERAHLLEWLGGPHDPNRKARLGRDRGIAPAVQKIVAFIDADAETLAGWRRYWLLRPEHAPKEAK